MEGNHNHNATSTTTEILEWVSVRVQEQRKKLENGHYAHPLLDLI